MRNLLKAELLKARKSLPLKILLLLMCGLAAVSALSNLNYVGSPRAAEMDIPFTGYDSFFASLRDMPTIAVIGIIVAGVLVCGDFDTRTVQVAISAGHGRLRILLSKVVAFFLAYLFLLLPYPLGRALLQGALIGFGRELSAGTLLHMLSAILTVALAATALNSLAVLLSFTVRRSVVVIGVSFVLSVLGGNALLSFGVANARIAAVLALTPLGFFRELALRQYAPEAMLAAAAISLACVAAMTALTYLLFRKAELK